MQAALHVDANQIQMAKAIWRQVSQELAGIQTERQAILDRIQQLESQPLTWLSDASATPAKTASASQLLKQVSELTANTLQQHVVLRQASCLVVWQICSPDTIARAMCYSWPAFPDLVGILKAMAAMAI